MSDEETNTPSELDLLKERADLMGLKYHPRIGTAKLAAMVNAKLSGETPIEDDTVEADEPPAKPKKAKKKSKKTPVKAVPTSNEPVSKAPNYADETEKSRQKRLNTEADIRKNFATELVRVRITCMNPHKSEWNGEIFTVQNRTIGTLRKFVPYNAENGWHIPRMMLEMLREKQCQVFHTVTQNGVKVRKGKLVPEFAIEELPDLTSEELKQIATRQSAQSTMDE